MLANAFSHVWCGSPIKQQMSRGSAANFTEYPLSAATEANDRQGARIKSVSWHLDRDSAL